MKLPPRQRARAALFELDSDSNYLLLFRTPENAHQYTAKGVVWGRKKKAAAKKTAAPAAKKTTGKAVKGKKASAAVPPPPPLSEKQASAALTLARQGSQTHRWEYVDDHGGWSPYDKEASKLVEMEYQSWQQQPSVFVRSVFSGDFHYSVNFNTMEQTNISHKNHRVRKIRRALAGGSFGKSAPSGFGAATKTSTAAQSSGLTSFSFGFGGFGAAPAAVAPPTSTFGAPSAGGFPGFSF